MSRRIAKQSSQTSTLLSGFAMVAMVEADLPLDISIQLLIAFGVTTTILIGVHLFALLISTCILPYVDAVGSRHTVDPEAVRLHKYVELAWAFSTIISIVLFMFELGIICWIICWITFAHVYGGNVVLEHVNGTLSDDESSASNRWIAALVASVVLGVFVLVFLVFAAILYYFIVLHRYEVSTKAMSELQALKQNLDVTSDPNDVVNANQRDFVAVDLHSDRS
ncbi:protein orai-2-like [Oscarella lobularis]|uniref:protein orai-2-like n=1 Tax=Oscarella lobularis TaxID=121494 RepID=UPI00331353B9